MDKNRFVQNFFLINLKKCNFLLILLEFEPGNKMLSFIKDQMHHKMFSTIQYVSSSNYIVKNFINWSNRFYVKETTLLKTF